MWGQVTVVAFFASGSMVQLILSILVSVAGFSYHVCGWWDLRHVCSRCVSGVVTCLSSLCSPPFLLRSRLCRHQSQVYALPFHEAWLNRTPPARVGCFFLLLFLCFCCV